MLIFSIACINCIENINSTGLVTKNDNNDNIILNKKSETPIDLVTNDSSTLENSTNYIKQHVVTDATQHEQNKKTIEIQYNTFERQYNGYQEFFICLLDDINASATNLITFNNEDVKDVIKKDLHIINIETITNIEKLAFTKKSYEFFNYCLKLCSKKFTNFYGKLDEFNKSCNKIYRNDDNIFFNNVLQKTKNLLTKSWNLGHEMRTCIKNFNNSKNSFRENYFNDEKYYKLVKIIKQYKGPIKLAIEKINTTITEQQANKDNKQFNPKKIMELKALQNKITILKHLKYNINIYENWTAIQQNNKNK